MRAAVAFGAMVLAGTAAAADPAVRLEVRGDCDVAAAVDRAKQVLGRDPFDDAAADALVVRTTSSATEAGAEVSIELRDGRVLGPRVLGATDCARLSSALAIVVATSVSALPTPAPLPPPPPAPLPSAPPNALAFDAIAGLGGAFDREGARAGTTGGMRVRLGRAAVELAAELALPSDRVLSNGATHVTTSTVGFTLRPCVAIGPASACAVGTAGWVAGRATGVLSADPASLPVASVGAGAGYTHALTPGFALRVRAELRVNVLGARFDVDQMEVWSSSRVEGWLGVDAIAHVP